MGKTVSKIIIIVILAGVLFFVIAGGLNSVLRGGSDGAAESSASSKTSSTSAYAGLVINEVMTSNKYAIALEDGTTPDWIELYNGSGSSINLSGFGISDDETDPYKYKFKETTIAADEYMILLADKTKTDVVTSGGLRHIGFGLAAAGETIVLTAPDGTVVDKLKTGEMPSDISYGRTSDGKLEYFANSTPGKENSGPTSDSPNFSRKISGAKLIINEYIVKNQSSLIDSDGERHPWLEIKNIGKDDINLKGYGLSDDGNNPKKWEFPDITIKSGEIKVVILSGKDKVVNNSEIHAGFRLGSTDKQLILTDAKGGTLDSVTIAKNIGTASSGRTVDDSSKWMYFPDPTPGKENTTKYFSDLSKADDRYLPKV